MPVYNYTCMSCHGEFEDIRSVADREFAACPECAGTGELMVATNAYMAKTRFIPPLPATRRWGDARKTPAKRARWT